MAPVYSTAAARAVPVVRRVIVVAARVGTPFGCRHLRRRHAMADGLDGRVSILEEKVAGVESLPARMEAVKLQIVQLRDEMRVEFAAVRAEIGQEIRGAEERLDRRMVQ